ncbi:ArsR/SmtB family transcription factor [Halostella salina]|uniref:ArsR/SmtB family transcription factor n=1 Tax=Halostella salina TaxID=1547897 RepID=UPI000EF8046B|nr:winged helix-turn-helix domain-containing protein [Halostella salina]
MSTPQPITTDRSDPTDGTPDDGETDPSVGTDELLDLLGDDHARRVLREVADAPRTGRELVATVDASKSTVYRRLERLESAGLVESTRTIDPDGHHRKQFHAVDTVLEFDLRQNGLCLSTGADRPDDGESGPAVVADD